MSVLKPKLNNAEKLSAALGAAREDYKSRVSAIVDTAKVRENEVNAEIRALGAESQQLAKVREQAAAPVA